ncbi:glycosyltransferase [uncultured Psychroserpens sp.]|uniref:glycosyltransferase n=1 Tax=uncultured Psychroserpens sp. TaxID=255436 RepID=UPI00262D951E|nr:glycosyltransferase [uncultured Psychroserpens sp.]
MVEGNVGVVTLTYGNRFDLISKTIDETLKSSSVKKMVVVINGVDKNTLIKLNDLKQNYPKLILHDLGYNSGSAKGFSEGIKRILLEDIEYLWLIDDDNLPQKDALNHLLNYWKSNVKGDNPLVSLLSYRPDRGIYKDAIRRNNPYLMLGPKNSFLGFHVVKKVRTLFSKEIITTNNHSSGVVAVAPYGGMFFKKELIETIGLPNEDMFLYADDHEFSYRITKNGGKIILVLDSILEDLELSFHLKKEKSFFKTRFFATESKNAIFYSVRNNIYFEKNFVTNKLIYTLNKYLYLILLSTLTLLKPKNIWKLPLIFKAVSASNKMKT